MRYRIILPNSTTSLAGFPVVYLLHGNGGDLSDWMNYSPVENLARNKFILVMPEGDASYYVNAASRPEDLYEDYIVRDLPSNVGSNFPGIRGSARAIVGVSMGGYGAVKIALTYPSLYKFAGAMSPPLDAPRRPFSVRRVQQWWALRSLFGPAGSATRNQSDPLLLVQAVEPENAPYLFLSCGDQESLLGVNRHFAAVLDEKHVDHEFHVATGGHDWKQWNTMLPSLFQEMSKRMQD